MPDVEVAKQASWGATRDNLVLGGEGNGIDGAHILTPMPYLISAGKVPRTTSRRLYDHALDANDIGGHLAAWTIRRL